MLISSENSILIIMDVQESLTPVMMQPREVLKYCSNLIKAARILDIPVTVTEHAPEKLGTTMVDIRDITDPGEIIYKTSFSATGEDKFLERLVTSGKKQVILAGIEMHICILQTAFKLKELDYEVFVVTNACSSRKKLDFDVACNRMGNGGINMVTYEMVLFEALEKADSPKLKEISKKLVDGN